MSKVFGIDVSFWQGNFNFLQAAREGVKFAILRGAYNLSKDTKFEEYYSNARASGLNIGVYHYTMATTPAEAIQEAKFLLENVLADKKFELLYILILRTRYTRIYLSHKFQLLLEHI